MKAKFMSRCFGVFLLYICISVFEVTAQTHFIYIQADNKQPFNATLLDKKYTSSEEGYLLIPRLKDGEYKLDIEFSNAAAAPLQFNINVQKKDAGYALKDFGEKGWGLYNLTTMEVIPGSDRSADVPEETTIEKGEELTSEKLKTNPFGEMLSDVVSDSNLTKPTEQVYAPVKKASARSEKNTKTKSESSDPTLVTIDDIDIGATDTPSVDSFETDESSIEKEVDRDEVNNLSQTRGVIKASEKSSKEGTDMVFVDFNNEGSDTISVFIPSASTSPKTQKKSKKALADAEDIIITEKNTDQPSASDSGEQKELNNPFFNEKETGTDKSSSDTQEAISEEKNSNLNEGVANKTKTSRDCNKMFSENDLNRVRKRIIEEADDEKMISIAKKGLKDKCILTEQVKNLGGLFLSDEGRYNFYNALYPYVYDPANYINLEDQLLDSFYRNKFKTSLR